MFNFYGGPPMGSNFEATYRAFPLAFIDKQSAEYGDKVIMPPSALDRLGERVLWRAQRGTAWRRAAQHTRVHQRQQRLRTLDESAPCCARIPRSLPAGSTRGHTHSVYRQVRASRLRSHDCAQPAPPSRPHARAHTPSLPPHRVPDAVQGGERRHGAHHPLRCAGVYRPGGARLPATLGGLS